MQVNTWHMRANIGNIMVGHCLMVAGQVASTGRDINHDYEIAFIHSLCTN